MRVLLFISIVATMPAVVPEAVFGGGREGDGDSPLLNELSRTGSRRAKAVLRKVWFNPKNASSTAAVPVGLIMTGKRFDSANEYLPDPWLGPLVNAFYQNGYCSLVLTCDRGNWKGVVVRQVDQAIKKPPSSIVPVDTNRVIVVTDSMTGFSGMRFINQFPARTAGAIFVNAPPFVYTSRGITAWEPNDNAWNIPFWIVVGGNASECSDLIVMWRKLFADAPAGSSITMDQWPGKGLGYLLPSSEIKQWLGDIARNRMPKEGRNRRLIAEINRYAQLVRRLDGKIFSFTPAASGTVITKKEGPVTVSAAVPRGWQRNRASERPYLSARGADGPSGKNPFVEIHLSTIPKSTMIACVFAVTGKGRAEQLLAFCRRRLEYQNYVPYRLASWKEKGWVFQLSSVPREYRGEWRRWVVLYAVRAMPESRNTSALLMVMDKSPRPDAGRMASAIRKLIETVKIAPR